ncbi:MAG: aquaporin [Actinomycetales bacterium]|nr:aquaporin [Actinomycetales bacterium]
MRSRDVHAAASQAAHDGLTLTAINADMPSSVRAAVSAEFTGTAVLTCAVISSGRLASGLTRDAAVALLANGISTIFVLATLIWVLMPVSGAHFNPVVTLVMRLRGAVTTRHAIAYALAQVAGAFAGAAVGNVMHGEPAVSISQTARSSLGQLLGEVIATAGLLTLVCVCIDRRAERSIPVLIPAWIGGALLFTSSTAFANPAVTIGRVFSDSFAGIAPASAVAFLMAQLVGALLGLAVAKAVHSTQEESHVVPQR